MCLSSKRSQFENILWNADFLFTSLFSTRPRPFYDCRICSKRTGIGRKIFTSLFLFDSMPRQRKKRKSICNRRIVKCHFFLGRQEFNILISLVSVALLAYNGSWLVVIHSRNVCREYAIPSRWLLCTVQRTQLHTYMRRSRNTCLFASS